MERFKQVTLTVQQDDIHIMMESLWHTVQRGDISDDDRQRAYKLREKLKACDEN